MNEFVYDVMNSAAKVMRKLKMAKALGRRDAVIVGDEHEIAYVLCGALLCLTKDTPQLKVNLIVDGEPRHPEFVQELKNQWPDFILWNSTDAWLDSVSNRETPECETERRENIFQIANLRCPAYQEPSKRGETVNELKKLLDHCEAHPENLFQLVTCIPPITEALPAVTNAIAEREYEVIFRDYPEDSLEKYVIQLEDCMRGHEQIAKRIHAVRLDRVFGPGITESDGIWTLDVIKDFFDRKTVTVYDRDRHDFASASYVRDAVASLLLLMANGRKGNIFHVSSWELSRFEIIENLYGSFPEYECKMETEHEGWHSDRPLEYRMLNARKLRMAHASNLNKVLYTTKLNALKATARWYIGVQNHIPKSDINVYFGRMDRIRYLELELLEEVDAICKQYGIQYFLSAGTMLGAVRHKGFIPWDDDVDIGMLPEDYKRFLEVCPEHLSLDYGYQTFSTEQTSHYIHDKIRIRNTYFSTKYSNRYEMMNGVYIDIFIYYKTADRPGKQKKHIRQIKFMRNVLGAHWSLKPKKTRYKHLYPIVWRIIKKIPWKWVHKYNRHVLEKYEKKNTHYRLDSTGFNLVKVGAVPDEWFHGTVEAEFCGRKFPILEHYDDFLRHWYGNHYMELLPLSDRKSVHDVVRIDLGQNLFDETMHDPRFRQADVRGELFEKIPGSESVAEKE
ncbi:MAG: LicD family protein [Lachnospiraceae bacterium]|nr:LicD family protein [Lachnospiraceae bacterium]